MSSPYTNDVLATDYGTSTSLAVVRETNLVSPHSAFQEGARVETKKDVGCSEPKLGL